MIDPYIKQRIQVAGIFLLQSYKILTETMMSLFIPQSCGDKMCSIQENYENRKFTIKHWFIVMVCLCLCFFVHML